MIKPFNRKQRLKLLEDKLLEVSKKQILLSAKKRTSMKRHVMTRIDEAVSAEAIGFEQLAQELEKLTLDVEPTSRFKLNTREHVMDLLTLRNQRLWLADLFKDLFARRRYWATAMAGLVLFVSTFGYVAQFPNVSAAKVSSVESVRGVVSVERGEVILPVEAGFLVEEGDRLVTGDDGWVDVVFVDDSLLTVGPGTTASVSQLWVAPENEAHTTVSIDLEKGRVWSTVLNLLPNDSEFVVHSGEFQASVDRRGSFDFIVAEDSKQLRVFSNLVDFSVHEGGVVHDGTLGPNLELMLTDGNLMIEKIEDLGQLKQDDVWIQTNLQSEENHKMRLDNFYIERVEQQAGVLPGDLRYQLKRGVEQARLLMSFDSQTRSDLNLAYAETRFAEATTLAHRGDGEGAQGALQDYQDILVGLAEVDADASVRTSAQQRSASGVHAVLEESKKVVEAVGPEGALYELRNFVEQTAVLVTADESARQVIQLETTADRLGLALELIQIGAFELAQTSLEDYQVGFERVLNGLGDLEFDDRRDVVFEILDQKLRDLQQLKLIGAELDALGNGEAVASESIQEQLRSLHEDTLYQLNTLVLNLKERAVLHLSTFLEDSKGEEQIQLEVLGRMKKNVPLDFEFISLINDVEALYLDQSEDVMIVEDALVTTKSTDEIPLEDYRDEQIESSGIPNAQEVKFDGV
jgi:hypothetical protein